MTDRTDPWGDFWAQNARARPGQASPDGGGCLPARWAAIEDAQRSAWQSFVGPLPNKARLLDLATGDGRVLRWIRDNRGDLSLTGTDLAPTLPEAPEGTRTQGGIAMEDLPFEPDSFEAVTSQFGFEYGDTRAGAEQVARVLAPGGLVGLLVHRGDGPILEHNRARRDQIGWVLRDKRLMEATRQALSAPQGAQQAHDTAAAAAREGAERFGSTSPAWEIAEAVRRTIVMGARSGVQSIVDTIGSIERHATNEVGRIDSLEGACRVADAREKLTGHFAAHGLALQSTEPVREPSGRAFGDFLTFA